RDRSKAVQPWDPAKEEDPGSARDDLDLGPGFVEERCGLERTLPSPDDGYAPAGKRPEVGLGRRVGDELARQFSELLRDPGKRGDAGGDDDPSGPQRPARREFERETGPVRVDPRYPPAVDV